ncbi:MAG TPA: T9SS type A sorting domain-containing protein [Bacteroidales bacterium]|nr:T9SS type A sorting domain-containing protein [Bacteroidales bacterium]
MEHYLHIVFRRIKLLPIFIIILFNYNLFAEGTKELMPTSGSFGNLEIYDMKRPFAAYYNTDPYNRLYFHISSTSETVYFGFRHIVKTGINNSKTRFRIKNPAGTIVYASTSIPTSAGKGYIENYTQAVAGPKISGVPANGYSPFSYTPTTTGDFYIEFNTDTTQGTYHLDYFDLTVVSSSGAKLPGRLWSYNWDISTRSFDNGFDAKMYVLSDDGYVTEVNFNGILAYGFTIACNNTGPGNTPGGNNENRKSVAGNHTRPQYKIFLNNPDENAYPSGELPFIVDNLMLADTPFYKEPVIFTVNINQPGIVQLIIDIDGNPGYQPGTEDVVIVENVNAGLDTIIWDEKDGFGNYVLGNVTVTATSSFACGTTHLPLYDPETHENGYIVTRIRPSTGQCQLYWDDSNFEGGTVNIDGSLSTGHSWAYFFGDVRTMNTWWLGYELAILNSFDFMLRNRDVLPVEFIKFNATYNENRVDVSWETASETNNDYFSVEKSVDGLSFISIGNVDGAGNSNMPETYQYADNNPLQGVSYYRIKQTDFNGDFAYSPIRVVNVTNKTNNISIAPNPVLRGESIQIKGLNSLEYTVSFYHISGKKVEEIIVKGEDFIPIDNLFYSGFYYVVVSSLDETFKYKLLVQ